MPLVSPSGSPQQIFATIFCVERTEGRPAHLTFKLKAVHFVDPKTQHLAASTDGSEQISETYLLGQWDGNLWEIKKNVGDIYTSKLFPVKYEVFKATFALKTGLVVPCFVIISVISYPI